MKAQIQEVDAKERLPEPGKLVEVKCTQVSQDWLKARLIKAGRFPLWQCLSYPGTLGMVEAWRNIA